MRRKDREMSREYGLSVIDRSAFGTLSVNDPKHPDLPYSIPLSIVRREDELFFHSARGGNKFEILQNSPKARIVFVDRVQVPDLFSDEELRELAEQGQLRDFVSKVFTTEFSSAIVSGRVEEIDHEENPEKFNFAMRAICLKYTPYKMDFFEGELDYSRKRLAFFSLKIDSITAKRKRFDASGTEMKWQRSE